VGQQPHINNILTVDHVASVMLYKSLHKQQRLFAGDHVALAFQTRTVFNIDASTYELSMADLHLSLHSR
jgi:hypothetical protein